MRKNPLVSVIITFFNREKLLQQTVESVLAQSYDRWELLLVDDGSADGSRALVQRYATQHPDKFYYLEHDGHQNRGKSASRNLGLQHSRGIYIAFLDPGDIWAANKLEEQVAILEARPHARMVFGDSHYQFPGTSNPEDHQCGDSRGLAVQTGTLYDPPILASLLHPLGTIPVPSVSDLLIRRDVVQQVGGFEEVFRDLYECYADHAFLSKVLLKHAVFVSGELWVKPRIHHKPDTSILAEAEPYRMARLFFLNWLGTHLLEQKVKDACVWNGFLGAISQFVSSDSLRHSLEPVDNRQSMWTLRVAGGDLAKLVFPPDPPDLVRIEIEQAKSPTRFDIQLNQPHLRVKADCRYRVKFRAKADCPRTMCVGLARTEAPWSGLGLYTTIELTPEWKSFEEEFVAQIDEENARILFDVGADAISVELSSVTLESLPDGTAIEPDLSQLLPVDRYYVEQFFARHADNIRGRVLELGTSGFARKFGRDRATEVDVVRMERSSLQGSMMGDLIDVCRFPSFDSMILPHTLHCIRDVRAAVQALHRSLKPGGVLLATFPGIVQTYDPYWGQRWCWNFTPLSVQRLFEEAFSRDNVMTQAFGCVPAMISVLNGLPREVLRQNELDYYEPGYEVAITVKAMKPVVPA